MSSNLGITATLTIAKFVAVSTTACKRAHCNGALYENGILRKNPCNHTDVCLCLNLSLLKK